MILADAVFYVDYVVADLQIAEVGEEGGDFGFLAAGARGYEVGFVEEIAGSEDGYVGFGEDEAIGDVGLKERGGEDFSGEVGGFVGIAFAAAGAAAQPEAGVVFGEDVSEALDFSRVGRGEDYAGAALVSFRTSSVMAFMAPWKRGAGWERKAASGSAGPLPQGRPSTPWKSLANFLLAQDDRSGRRGRSQVFEIRAWSAFTVSCHVSGAR